MKHSFTSLEIAGFESIANSIGVSYTNYRNFHSTQATLLEKLSQSTGFTAVDVAQAVRHEARGHLATARERLTSLSLWSDSQTKEAGDRVRKSVDDTDEELSKVNTALDKIKAVTKPPDMTPEKIGLSQFWEDTFAIMQGRLTLENIDVVIKGKNVEVCVAPEPVRHAFLNLVLNSIDAFRLFGKKRNRQISVTVDEPSPFEEDVHCKYSDNAGGFEPTQLKGPDLGRPFQPADVFLQGVSSKTEGSGYGLFLALMPFGNSDLSPYLSNPAWQKGA